MYLFLSQNRFVIATSPTPNYFHEEVSDVLVNSLDFPINEYQFINNEFIHNPRPSLNHVIVNNEWCEHPSPEILAVNREAVSTDIKEVRDFRKSGGVNVAGKWFHSDESSRLQQLGLNLLGNNLPANIPWKTMDGSFTILTPEIVRGIFSAVMILDITTFAFAEHHLICVLEEYDPYKYVYQKWPPIY